MNARARRFIRSATLAFGLGGAALTAVAGDVNGVVSDTTDRGFLPGATVTIVENGRSEATDSGGRFRFTGLAEGAYTLRVAYLGHPDTTEAVSVPASGTVSVSIRMTSDVVHLDKFMVQGIREGRSRAIQQKRNQTNISDLVASDAIGNLPDRNVAEAVARLPGVSLSLEQGEGRYVSIRGVEPNLNQVTLDGATMAAPGGTRLGRATPLDTLGASQISQLEVIKSVTPDLDANSLGGTINIKTASPFDRKGRFVAGSVTANFNESSEKFSQEAQLNYSDLFGAGQHWGLAANVNYDKRYFENHWLEARGWALRNGSGSDRYVPNEFQVKPEYGDTKRYGASFALEFRPDDTLRLYLRPNYSFANNHWETFETNISVDNANQYVTYTTPTSGVFAGSRTRTERRALRRLYEQSLFTTTAGFEKVMGDLKLEGAITHSAAKEDRVYDKSREFRNATGASGPVNFDISTFEFMRWASDPAIDTPSTYPLRRTRDDYGVVDENTSSAKLDLRWDSERILGHPGFLKAGFKYIQRSRVTDLESRRLEPVTSWRLDSVGVLPGVPVYDGRYNTGFLLDWAKIDQFISANPALVRSIALEEAQNSIEDDYDIDEFIYAGYGMGSVTFDKLTLLGGVRWEKTDATIRAVEARTAGSTLLGRFPTSGTTSYGKLFPNMQAAYRFNDRLVLRAAVTETIGRPAYEDARPLANFRYSALGSAALDPSYPYSGTLDIGNPKLGPFQSMNYDLSLEWYLKNSGMISVAAFRKEIDDPIYLYSETQSRVTHSGIALETLALSSRRNADSGLIEGLEMSVYLPFWFLPHPFDGFGVDANYTVINSNVKIPTRAGEDFPFFRQPGDIRNIALFYEKTHFSARIAYNYADGQLYSVGNTKLNDNYRLPREQYDLLMRYRINENYSISVSVRNLTEEPEQFRFGYEGLMRTSRLLGRDYKVSINFNF